MNLRKGLGHPLMRDYGLSVGAIIVALALLLLSVRPAVGKIMGLRAERATDQETLASLTAKVVQLEDFAAKADVLDTDFEHFDLAVPSESDVPTLLTQIQAIATLSGVEITALQFSGGEAAAAKILEIRVKCSSESSFNDFLAFLHALEITSRVIDVKSVRYTVRTEEEKKVPVLATELTLVSYYTPKPTLLPETPITASFSDPTFDRNSRMLERLTPHKTEIP